MTSSFFPIPHTTESLPRIEHCGGFFSNLVSLKVFLLWDAPLLTVALPFSGEDFFLTLVLLHHTDFQWVMRFSVLKAYLKVWELLLLQLYSSQILLDGEFLKTLWVLPTLFIAFLASWSPIITLIFNISYFLMLIFLLFDLNKTFRGEIQPFIVDCTLYHFHPRFYVDACSFI